MLCENSRICAEPQGFYVESKGFVKIYRICSDNQEFMQNVKILREF